MIFIINCDEQIKEKTATVYETTDGDEFIVKGEAEEHQERINRDFVLLYWPGTNGTLPKPPDSVRDIGDGPYWGCVARD